jgi:hypothetical protein
MCSARDNVALPTLGFPIRESAGHWPFSASPRLIAAVHALHRLLVPRHPPYALTILTVIFGKSLAALPGDTRVIGYCAVFKVREEAKQAHRSPGPSPISRRQHAGLSKLNSMRAVSSAPLAQACGLPDPVDVLVADRARGERRRAQRLRCRRARPAVTILLTIGALG